MNRCILLIVLAVAAVIGLVFGINPKLDLALAGLFYDPSRGGFLWANIDPFILFLRDLSRGIVTVIVAPAALAMTLKFLLPGRPFIMPSRASLLMIATLAIGPGIVSNVILKSHWGRPRPIDVVQFNGDEHFVAWWDPRGDCPDNCSFVAGEPSGAFWTLAPAALLPAPWRALASAAAVAFGTGIGVVRMMGGGHFFTDVVFSGVFTFMVIWLTHGLLYRWPATRTTDLAIERAVEHMGRKWQNAVRGLLARLRLPPR